MTGKGTYLALAAFVVPKIPPHILVILDEFHDDIASSSFINCVRHVDVSVSVSAGTNEQDLVVR